MAFIDAVRNVFGILGILMGNYTQVIFIRYWVHTRLYRIGIGWYTQLVRDTSSHLKVGSAYLK